MNKPPPFPEVERPSVPPARAPRAYHHHSGCDCPACWPEGKVKKPEHEKQLLKDAVAALMLAGPEINDDGRNQGALWALYDCLFGILEYLGADGLPQKESEEAEHG